MSAKRINLKVSKKEAQKLTRMQALSMDLQKAYGPRASVMGSAKPKLDVIPTGSLALDYELGIGGIARGHATGIFGPEDIGKSVLALSIVAQAQNLGLDAVWLAAGETSFDGEWAAKHGVDTSQLVVGYPRTGQDAFQMMYRMIEAEVDVVIFDSVGAVLDSSEIGGDAVPRVGGQAGTVTWGMKMCVPAAFHSNTALVMLNQQRDDMQSRYGGVKQPGGKALSHMEATIIHLRPGSNGPGKHVFKTKIGGSEVEIGRPILAHIRRNKLSEGSGRKAQYDMYYTETDEYPFGIDIVADVINTGKRAGVIAQRGSMFDLPDGTTHKGAAAVAKHIADNPSAYDLVREGVMGAMEKKFGPIEQIEPMKEVEGGEDDE